MEPSKRGRPRSTDADRSILEAARDLLLEGGYDALNLAAVAERAGVAKQTVYRRWSSKSHLVAGAVLAGVLAPSGIAAVAVAGADPGVGAEAAEPREASDEPGGLHEWMRRLAASLESPANAATVRALAAAAADDDDDAARLYERFTGPTRRLLVEVLEAGRDRGEVRTDADLEAVADAVFGVALYRILARIDDPAAGIDSLATILVDGLAPRTATR
ncbi:TetR/AcrR family transcriptional regulator [Agromyces sp. NPDC058064]|uniref:TetR/AcrR family transcriptional regulator n=1 Tax=Agromyces sp. NPDC058064 TaxID=3346322 RepID=UPI0036D987FD